MCEIQLFYLKMILKVQYEMKYRIHSNTHAFPNRRAPPPTKKFLDHVPEVSITDLPVNTV